MEEPLKNTRLIFHIDVNSAFLSWESVYRLNADPQALDLRTIPSAVGGDAKSRHGIVLAKSTLAKQYGLSLIHISRPDSLLLGLPSPVGAAQG